MLESYNQRENIRITGVPEEFRKNQVGKFIKESEKTVENIGKANDADSNVLHTVISITHRLPGRNEKLGPINVQSCSTFGDAEEEKGLRKQETHKRSKYI